MANFDVGTLSITPVSRDQLSVTTTDSADVFEFDVLGSTANINLNLHNMNGNAQLFLYRDNGDGALGSGDTLVASSTRSSNLDDSINVRTTGGTYFAQVNRQFDAGNVVYDLDMSAPSRNNLLPKETSIGTLTRDQTFVGNSVGNTDTSDTYYFTLPTFAGVNVELSGMSTGTDADLRLIRDDNNNRIADSGDFIVSSSATGNATERISDINASGNYFVQVNQFSGNTNYQLRLDHFSTTFV